MDAWQAMHDAAEEKRLFEKITVVYDRDLDARQDGKFWWRVKALTQVFVPLLPQTNSRDRGFGKISSTIFSTNVSEADDLMPIA